MVTNEMTVSFSALSRNEAFSRVVIAAFAAQLNPDLNDLTDIKTAVSEAVTNAVIHGYDGIENGVVTLNCRLFEGKEADSEETTAAGEGASAVSRKEDCAEEKCIRHGQCRGHEKTERSALIEIVVKDEGRGIEDINRAKEPLYTSKPELERSGMGFTVMETFMDSVQIISEKDKGTTVILTKKINGAW